jgi:ketosteroid isomerase-like protein
MKKSGFPEFGFMLILLFNIVLNCAQKSPEQLVQNFEGIYNSHDVEKIMSLYSNDAVFEVAGMFKFSDREKIRGAAQYDSALSLTMTISHIEVRGDTAFFKLKENNDWLDVMGIAAAYYDPAFIVFNNNKIQHLKAIGTQETMKAFQDALAGFMPWVNENRSEKFAEIAPGGKLIFTVESAVKFLDMAKEYKQFSKIDN